MWSLANDGSHLVEDEVVFMMHAESNASTLFCTFTRHDGYSVNLVGSHYIVVFMIDENKVTYVSAPNVTLQHRLVMLGRSVEIQNITRSYRFGFYSPLRLSGNLLVNNISPSVYVGSIGETTDVLHRVFLPVRIYYHLTRWLFGHNYDPLRTNVKHGLHPLPVFMKKPKRKMSAYLL